jgi:hypothetical protein
MHSVDLRRSALQLLDDGLPRAEVCRQLKVSPQSTYRWQQRLVPLLPESSIHCFRCDSFEPHWSYTYLLGQYLGDGHIARSGRSLALRIYCTNAYPLIIDEVAASMASVAGTSVHFSQKVGCTAVSSTTLHWACMLPQHGSGMKHARKIELADWQRDLVGRYPHGLIRGLIQSDGCLATNVVHRPLPGGIRTYTYPRYFFSNLSADIRGIFTDTLDVLGIAWKQNRHNCISVARREAVAALDEFVGPKA